MVNVSIQQNTIYVQKSYIPLFEMMNSICILLGNNDKMGCIIESYLFLIYKVSICIENTWKNMPQLLTTFLGGNRTMKDPHIPLSFFVGYFPGIIIFIVKAFKEMKSKLASLGRLLLKDKVF